MNSALQRTRGEHCVSDQRFDRLLAGELGAEEARAVHDHAAGCALCSTRLRELEAARSRFDVPFTPKQSAARRRTIARAPAWGAALALAACVCLLVFTLAPERELRLKGERRFGFFVLHAGEVRAGAAGEVLAPGDSLRFVARSNRPSYLAVLSLDGAGQASVYYPPGATAAPLSPNVEHELDSAVELDDTLGDETLHALFCREPVPLEPLRAELAARAASFSAPEGCELETVRVRKVAPR